MNMSAQASVRARPQHCCRWAGGTGPGTASGGGLERLPTRRPLVRRIYRRILAARSAGAALGQGTTVESTKHGRAPEIRNHYEFAFASTVLPGRLPFLGVPVVRDVEASRLLIVAEDLPARLQELMLQVLQRRAQDLTLLARHVPAGGELLPQPHEVASRVLQLP